MDTLCAYNYTVTPHSLTGLKEGEMTSHSGGRMSVARSREVTVALTRGVASNSSEEIR